MRRAWFAAALLCLSLGQQPQHGAALAAQPTSRAATLLEKAKQCIFMLQARRALPRASAATRAEARP
jgi:hypothetical protein